MWLVWNNNARIYGGIMNIYDFDKTIYNGDSSVDFFKYCLKKNKKIIILLPKIVIAMLLYILKIYDKEKFKSVFFSFVKYFKNIDQIVLEFWEYKKYKLKNFYLKNAQKDDIIISASPEFLLKPIAVHYKFTLIATNVDENTGELIGKNCYGEEKLKRLNKMKIKKCNCFYSDSTSDLPLSKIAKKAYIVKKENILEWDKYKPSLKKKILNLLFNRDFIVFTAIDFINLINSVWLILDYSSLKFKVILFYICIFLINAMFSYSLNSILNFKSKLSFSKLLLFVCDNIPKLLIQICFSIILVKTLKWSKIIAYIIITLVVSPLTYILIQHNVFKNKCN